MSHKSVTTPGRSHSFLASRRCGQVESMRPVVLATPVASAMPSAGAPAASASVSGPPKPARPPVAATPAVFTCTTSRCWQDLLNVLQSDTAPQQQALTRVADRATEHTIRFETWVGYNSTWKYFKERARAATCHAALLLHSCAHALIVPCLCRCGWTRQNRRLRWRRPGAWRPRTAVPIQHPI